MVFETRLAFLYIPDLGVPFSRKSLHWAQFVALSLYLGILWRTLGGRRTDVCVANSIGTLLLLPCVYSQFANMDKKENSKIDNNLRRRKKESPVGEISDDADVQAAVNEFTKKHQPRKRLGCGVERTGCVRHLLKC